MTLALSDEAYLRQISTYGKLITVAGYQWWVCFSWVVISVGDAIQTLLVADRIYLAWIGWPLIWLLGVSKCGLDRLAPAATSASWYGYVILVRKSWLLSIRTRRFFGSLNILTISNVCRALKHTTNWNSASNRFEILYRRPRSFKNRLDKTELAKLWLHHGGVVII